jgi:hypothetical protein
MAVKTHKILASCEGPRNANRHLYCLGSGGYESHTVRARNVLHYFLSKLNFLLCLEHSGRDNKDALHLFLDGALVALIAMPPDTGPHANRKIDQLASVHIPQSLPNCTLNEDWGFSGGPQIALATWHDTRRTFSQVRSSTG